MDDSDIPNIYNVICQLAVTRLGLDATWIETDGLGSSGVHLAASHGLPVETIPSLKSTWDHNYPMEDFQQSRVKTIDELPQLIPRSHSEPFHICRSFTFCLNQTLGESFS